MRRYHTCAVTGRALTLVAILSLSAAGFGAGLGAESATTLTPEVAQAWFAGNPAPGADIDEHVNITEYLGPQTCVACHQDEAEDLFHAVHYQQSGPTPNVPNIPGNAGKLDMGFNTYCGTPLSSRQFACASCHVSYGKMPQKTMTPEQLNNIDCLMCHQDKYQRKPGPPFELVRFQDYLGIWREWQMPIEDAQGNFNFVPDEDKMPISIVEAARTVHRPTRASCLRCHAYSAGSDCGKRGDLSSVNADPPRSIDIHMSSAGENLRCHDCHEYDQHRFLGRGLDLRPNDRPEGLTCLNCHPAAPHGELDENRLDEHAARVACQTCHIPAYARAMTTEVERDWGHPVWAQGLFGGQGGFKPEELREANLVPSYQWFDGTSEVYVLGQVSQQNASGEYELGVPRGWATWTQARLHPLKEHWSNSARHDATGQLVPHATFKFFVTGDFDRAVEDGMVWAGLTGSWTLVRVHTFQTINHGVQDHENALRCGSCHEGYSGGPVRMDLQGELGYALKGPMQTICTQCHGYEQPKNFEEMHEKHVKDKHYDCRWCHQFSRPERNLAMPSQDFPGDLNCDGEVDFGDINPFVLAVSNPGGYYDVWSCNRMNGDINGDQRVDFGDINPFVRLLTR